MRLKMVDVAKLITTVVERSLMKRVMHLQL
jgi:hypothetical protein